MECETGIVIGIAAWPRAYLCRFFFFQAEDGIRYLTVTGVQTCALPIFALELDDLALALDLLAEELAGLFAVRLVVGPHDHERAALVGPGVHRHDRDLLGVEIGRASCRERV